MYIAEYKKSTRAMKNGILEPKLKSKNKARNRRVTQVYGSYQSEYTTPDKIINKIPLNKVAESNEKTEESNSFHIVSNI